MKKFFRNVYLALFYRKEPTVKLPPVTRNKLKKSKILIVVGHTKTAPGTTTYLRETEYSFNSRVANYLKRELINLSPDITVEIEFRDRGGLAGAYSRGNSIKPDITIELHLNGFGRPAFGLEVLALHDDVESILFADKLSDLVSEKLGIAERRKFVLNNNEIDGVLKVSRGDNGYENLRISRDYTTAPIRVLIEPTFVNFKTHESEQIIEDGGLNYAKVLAESILA